MYWCSVHQLGKIIASTFCSSHEYNYINGAFEISLIVNTATSSLGKQPWVSTILCKEGDGVNATNYFKKKLRSFCSTYSRSFVFLFYSRKKFCNICFGETYSDSYLVSLLEYSCCRLDHTSMEYTYCFACQKF
jgi:hypothetical protein